MYGHGGGQAKTDSSDIFLANHIEKFKKYEADYTRRLMAKYFSKKNLYGGNVFDENTTIDDELIKSSRWPCTRSYADPVQAFEDQNSSESVTIIETAPGNISNGKHPPKKNGKELKKSPPKVLLFEQKLERPLVQPCHEWDEINVPERLRTSSLWKDFVEIETGIIKRILSWVDWPFVIRGALRRLFGTPPFIQPLFYEETLIAELALDTMKIDFPSPKELLVRKKAEKEAAKAAATAKAAQSTQMLEPSPLPIIESSPEPSNAPAQPPAKKQKVDEKSKRKAPAKRKEAAKAIAHNTNVGPQQDEGEETDVEVDLPPGASLLQNKKLSISIMRHLLTNVDSDTVNEGWIQNNLEEFVSDSMKGVIRAIGLVYRTVDKVVKQKARIKELKDIDKERGEKLLDIERRFRDVKSIAEDLIAELHSLKQRANEGAKMMKVMINKFDEAKAKIEALEEMVKQKDADNSVLVARIVNEYERATLKARYELLKEYKQGLLVDADIKEEIELFEESLTEAGDSSSTPVAIPTPTVNEPEPVAV